MVGWNKLRAVPAFQNCRTAGTARSLFQPTVLNREVNSDTIRHDDRCDFGFAINYDRQFRKFGLAVLNSNFDQKEEDV